MIGCLILIYVLLSRPSQLISQETNHGIEYEYYLPNGRSRQGYYWSSGSWSSCSKECGSGQTRGTTWIDSQAQILWKETINSSGSPSGYQSRLVFCSIDNEAYPDYLCASLPRPQSNRTCNPHPCPQTQRLVDWKYVGHISGSGSQMNRHPDFN